MRTIHKFTLPALGAQTITAPRNAKFLTVQLQHGFITLWAIVDTAEPLVDYRVATPGTGFELAPCNSLECYVGTVQAGEFVWHVFVEPIAPEAP